MGGCQSKENEQVFLGRNKDKIIRMLVANKVSQFNQQYTQSLKTKFEDKFNSTCDVNSPKSRQQFSELINNIDSDCAEQQAEISKDKFKFKELSDMDQSKVKELLTKFQENETNKRNIKSRLDEWITQLKGEYQRYQKML